jgi:Domain of unknown function (DUF4432)
VIQLYGRTLNRQDLYKRMGSIDQVAGVRLSELSDGVGRGVRTAHLRTGGGLSATILVDRALDIYDAEFNGMPLAWLSSTGPAHPAYYEPPGSGWLRGFGGGLLVTCGLTAMGAPSVDEGQAFGLHGRASYTPASHVNAGGRWEGDQYVMFVEGQVRETVVFGENLLLKRRVESRLGENRLSVSDTILNEGFQHTPLMLLYHVNAGFPVVDAGSRLIAPTRRVTPRDDEARRGMNEFDAFNAPMPDFREQVFFHDMAAAPDGYVTVGLVNPALNGGEGFGFYVRYRQRELPCYNEWKMMGEGVYTVGMEPATTHTLGRAAARADGSLQFLAPGEERQYHVEFGVLSSRDEIAQLEKQAQALLKGRESL